MGPGLASSVGRWILDARASQLPTESCQAAGRQGPAEPVQPEPAGDLSGAQCVQQVSVKYVRFSSASSSETRFCQKDS